MFKNIILKVCKSLLFSFLVLIYFIITSSLLKGQVFDEAQNPPSVKWRQINTKQFQIIFPATLKREAIRMANTLDFIIPQVASSLNTTPKKISIILQNQGTTSNGFVQLAPRRAEFFTTPSQEFDYQDWLNSLAVHELRHVVQFDKLTGNLSAPFFEELALAIFGVTLPPWFYEGDAVGIETSLTKAGRGRLPSWELFFRANTLSGRTYRYSKNYFGSVKDRTPGYYQLGYFMTSKLRRDYGKFIVDTLISGIAKNPIRPYSFSTALKKFTGLSSRKLHNETVAELKKLWLDQSAQAVTIPYISINKRNSAVPIDYMLPSPVSLNNILVLKNGYSKAPAFYLVDKSGNEKLILKIGYQETPNFSYSSGKIVWDEFRFDKRYHKRSYNVINIFNLNSRSFKQLTHKSRLFSPALSPDGKTIVAVKITESNNISLVEIDPETGEQLKEYANDQNFMIQIPAFNQNGTKLIYVAVTSDGESIMEITRQTSKINQVLPFQKQQFSKPSYAGEQIIFKAHFNGIDNVYRFNPAGKKIYQLTSAQYGAFNPIYDSATAKIFFNNYQVSGYDISSIHYEDTAGTEISKLKNTFINFAEPLAIQEGMKNVFDSVPGRNFKSQPYTEIKNLFYFHSLSPITDNSDINNNPTIGLQLKSNNKLNTLNFYAGYQYNTGLHKSEYLSGFTYKKFYPLLDIKFINRARLSYFKSAVSGNAVITPVSWRENVTEFSMRVPFLMNKLNQIYRVGLNVSTSYTSRYSIQNTPSKFSSKLLFPIKYQIYFNHNTLRSARDLAPPWGQNLTVSYEHLPLNFKQKGELITIRSLFYTPGVLTNHSFQTSFNVQSRSGDFNLVTEIPVVSGYYQLNPAGELQNTLLFDYRFPLFYPDLEIGPLAYVKRLKAGLFADFENVFNNQFFPRTFGIELLADMNLLRFYLPNFEVSSKLIFVSQNPTQNPIFETGLTYQF